MIWEEGAAGAAEAAGTGRGGIQAKNKNPTQ